MKFTGLKKGQKAADHGKAEGETDLGRIGLGIEDLQQSCEYFNRDHSLLA